MDIKVTQPSRTFITTDAGAGLNFEVPCTHGNPSLSLHLISEQEDTTEDLAVVLPVCAAATLFGMALANVQVAHGAEAAEEFLTDMLAAKEQAAAAITARLARFKKAREACCQAGSFAEGREHTCNPSDDSRS